MYTLANLHDFGQVFAAKCRICATFRDMYQAHLIDSQFSSYSSSVSMQQACLLASLERARAFVYIHVGGIAYLSSRSRQQFVPFSRTFYMRGHNSANTRSSLAKFEGAPSSTVFIPTLSALGRWCCLILADVA